VFSIEDKGDGLVFHVKGTADSDPVNHVVEGSIEMDRLWRPIRAQLRRHDAEAYTYTLEGTPAKLAVRRDDGRDPQDVVADKPLDVYVPIIVMSAYTPLCQAKGEQRFASIGVEHEPFATEVHVTSVAPAAGLTHVVVDMEVGPLDLYCDGMKLVAAGMAKFDSWAVRQGREADFAAARAATK
jgi:hypothetical protein